MDDLQYKPNMDVVRGARSFIRALCQTYGTKQGMDVWDKTREVLGDQAASDIFLGMLTGNGTLTVKSIGYSKIEAIKEFRHFTHLGLKDSKDFMDKVESEGPQVVPDHLIHASQHENFIQAMRQIGCAVE